MDVSHIALFWEASDWSAEQVIVNINTPVMTKKWMSGRNITGKSESGGVVEILKSAESGTYRICSELPADMYAKSAIR